MDFAILRTAKHKSIGTIQSAVAHQLREIHTPNADPKRRQKNIDSVKNSAEVMEELANRLDGVPIPKRGFDKRGRDQRAVLAIEYLLAVPPSAEWKNDRKTVKEWAKASLDFLEKKHGKGAVLSYHVQFDEQTPHLAVFLDTLKETKKGKVLDAKRFLDGSDKLSKIQDAYAEAMKPFGLLRGVKGTKATHEETKRYRARVKKEKALPPSRLDLILMNDGERLEYVRTLEAQHAEATAKAEKLEQSNEKQARTLISLAGKVDALKEEQKLLLKAGAKLLKSAFTREEFEKALGVDIKGKQDVFDAVLKSGKYSGQASTFAHAFALVSALMPNKAGKSWEELARMEAQKPQPAPPKPLEAPRSPPNGHGGKVAPPTP